MIAEQPLVTIIVAVFNCENTLQQCIDSVSHQSYHFKELIVIDGDSTDQTPSIINKNSDHIHFSVSEKDRGIYDAWNKGLRHANGEWICFLGADDYLYDPFVLEKMIAHIQKAQSISKIVYGQVALVDQAGLEKEVLGDEWESIKKKFQSMMCIPHPAVFHHRTFFQEYGMFNDSFRIAGDYEILLRYLKTNNALSVGGLIMVAMRVGGVSSNPSNALNSFKEIRIAQKINGEKFINKSLFLRMVKEYIRVSLWTILGEKNAIKLLDCFRRARGLPPYWALK